MSTDTSNVRLYQIPSLSNTSGATPLSPLMGQSVGPVWHIIADCVLLFLSGLIAFLLRYGSATDWNLFRTHNELLGEYLGVWLVYTVVVVLSCHARRLYDPLPARTLAEESTTILKALFWATLLLTSLLYVSHFWLVSRLVVLTSAALSAVVLLTWRYSRHKAAEQRLARGIGVRHVLVVGAGKIGRALAYYLDQNRQLGYEVKGFLDQRDHDPCVLGQLEDLEQIVRAHFIDAVFITIPSEREVVKQVALVARHLHINVKVIPELYDGIAGRAPVQYLGDFPISVIHHEPVPALGLLMKRIVDVVCSAIGLIILSPLFAVVAAIIKLDSPGPVIYHSQRVGKKGRIFMCHKFRTMVNNAEALKKDIEHLNEREGILFKTANDPRVTRVGRVLRRYSIDEFTQLWNVFKGEMSLIGPRPAIPSEFEQYDLRHFRRLDMTPGLTGLWQVTARNDPSFETYMALDLQYIENWSPLLDMKLVLKTIPVVLGGTGL